MLSQNGDLQAALGIPYVRSIIGRRCKAAAISAQSRRFVDRSRGALQRNDCFVFRQIPDGMQLAGPRCEMQKSSDARCPPRTPFEDALCFATPERLPSAKVAVANALVLTRKDAPVSSDIGRGAIRLCTRRTGQIRARVG
jgi:hypothetical protein